MWGAQAVGKQMCLSWLGGDDVVRVCFIAKTAESVMLERVKKVGGKQKITLLLGERFSMIRTEHLHCCVALGQERDLLSCCTVLVLAQ